MKADLRQAAKGDAPAHKRQFLSFKLAGEEYGVDILRVQEIRGWTSVTVLPHAPDWSLGVVDLRGCMVPVIDLRRRLNFDRAAFGPATVVIVLHLEYNGETRRVGLVVDEVSEVYDVLDSQLRPLPDIGSTDAFKSIEGLAQVGSRTIILLDAVYLVLGASASLGQDIPSLAELG